MEYGFRWPVGLTGRCLSRLLFAKRAGTLTEVLPEILEQTHTTWTLEECYTWLEEFEATMKASTVYVLDHSTHPESWTPPALPKMVKAAVYFVDPDLCNTPRILRRYQGAALPTTLTEDERSEALAALRQTPVYYQPCKEEGCNQEVLITLGQVGRAIQKFGLTADNPYQPSTRCKACRAKYREQVAPGKKRRNNGSVATLGEIAAAHGVAHGVSTMHKEPS